MCCPLSQAWLRFHHRFSPLLSKSVAEAAVAPSDCLQQQEVLVWAVSLKPLAGRRSAKVTDAPVCFCVSLFTRLWKCFSVLSVMDGAMQAGNSPFEGEQVPGEAFTQCICVEFSSKHCNCIYYHSDKQVKYHMLIDLFSTDDHSKHFTRHYSFAIHPFTHTFIQCIYVQHLLSDTSLTTHQPTHATCTAVKSNSGFRILLKDTLTHGGEEPGIKPPPQLLPLNSYFKVWIWIQV